MDRNPNNVWKEKTSLPKESILDLLNLFKDANIFKWNNQIFKQLHNTPMGSPISVVLAELTM